MDEHINQRFVLSDPVTDGRIALGDALVVVHQAVLISLHSGHSLT